MILILGKSGAGKDTLARAFCDAHPEYHYVISYTTRPKRDYEADGYDYRFVSDGAFNLLNGKGLIAAPSTFNGWQYGMMAADCNENAVAVVNPEGMRDIIRAGIPTISILLEVDDRSRMNMLLNRGDDVDEIVRRWPTDQVRFEGVNKEVDFVINNENYVGDENLLITYVEESLKIARGEISPDESDLVMQNKEGNPKA